jgi:hypothetical protein
MTWLEDSIYVVFAVFIALIMLFLAKWLFDAISGLMGRGHYRVTWKDMIIMIVILLVVIGSLWEISQFAWEYGIKSQDPVHKIIVLVALTSGLLVSLLEWYRRRRR